MNTTLHPDDGGFNKDSRPLRCDDPLDATRPLRCDPKLWLAEFGHKFRLHFLPPYCPDDNRIERKLWRELHANVTVNHRCQTIEELMKEAVHYLKSHNRRARLGVRELRTAI